MITMIWLTRALLFGLSAQLTLAKTPSKDEAPVAGSKDNLAYEPISQSTIYTSNATSPDSGNVPPTTGWWSSQICAQKTYCIYTNLALGRGHGIVLLTKFAEFQKIERLDQHLDKAEDRIEATTENGGPPFEESYILDKGPGLTATTQLRRGKPLMQAAPVLMVHKDFFADVWRRKEREKMLEVAVGFLPEKTRGEVERQRSLGLGPGGKKGEEGKDGKDASGKDRKAGNEAKETGTGTKRSIEQILLASPFEIDLGSNSYQPVGQGQGQGQANSQADHSKHYVNYPSMALFTHSCRPNVAFHIDGNMALRTTVARKVSPGEELTIAYIDPMKPRKERQEWVGKYRPRPSSSSTSSSPSSDSKEGSGCPCPACTGHSPRVLSKQHGHPHTSSPATELSKSDARLSQLENLRSELRNGHESHSKVTPEMIENFLKLLVEEGLESKLAEAYELAATNYNYLGKDRMAKRYADKAVQAARIEYGRDANDVVAMRIMAGDVRGHWSFGFRSKGKGRG